METLECPAILARLLHQPAQIRLLFQAPRHKRDGRRFGGRGPREGDDPHCTSFSLQQGINVTCTVRSRGPSSSISITDCHVPSTSFPADTGTVRDGPRIEEAM